MPKHWQESEIVFRRHREPEPSSYPVSRGIVVHQYGGTLEECVAAARKELHLGEEWEVVRAEMSEN